MKNRNFQALAEEVEKILKEHGKEWKVQYKSVWKNNSELNGLLIFPDDGRNITPTVYFNDETPAELADQIEKAMLSCPVKVDPEKWMTREYFKTHLTARIIPDNATNRNGLEKEGICYKVLEKLGLVVTAHINLDDMEGASIQIRREMLDRTGMSEFEVFTQAVSNLSYDFKVQGMLEMMREMMPMVDDEVFDMTFGKDEEIMYVISNSRKLFGAANLICNEALMETGRKIGTDHYYILPSSVHELIAVAKKEDMAVQDLLGMVKEVNGTQVDPNDQLCDGVFEVNLDGNMPEIIRIA